MTEDKPVNEEVVTSEVVEVQPEIIDGPPSGMKKMYLSGPMTGIEKYNHDVFNRVAAEFRMAGFEVCSPSEFFDGDRTKERHEYMREAVKYLLEADTVILLPGWEESKGARLEAAIAQELDLIIVEYVDNNGEQQVFPGSLTVIDEEQPDGNFGSFTPITKSE